MVRSQMSLKNICGSTVGHSSSGCSWMSVEGPIKAVSIPILCYVAARYPMLRMSTWV